MKHAVHPMEMSHIGQCLHLWGATEGMVLRDDSDHPTALRRFLERNPGMSFVAIDEEQVVASVLCGHDGRRGHIYQLAVRTPWRRTQCAAALLDAACKALRSEGITRCNAHVLDRNLAALSFWSGFGATTRKDLQVVTLDIEIPAQRA